MIAFVIWAVIGGAILLWNYFGWGPYIGLRFTDRWFGQPLSGAWLAGLVSAYCLIRFFIRRRRTDTQGPVG